MRIDSGAVIWSAPERERSGRPLIVLLHGYGSHEGDLFQLAPRLPLGPVIASVRAPISENGGWAWFDFPDTGIADPDPALIEAATTALLDWLDGLDYTSVSLLGFSQGAVVALQALRRAPERFRSIVALSGFVAGEVGGAISEGVADGDEELRMLRPPVFWGRGTLDEMIPTGLISRTEKWLPEHSDAVVRIYEDLAHGISSDELTDISAFLRETGR
jgi:phospholipase/carboxylesterase